jgi:hypothetical protein
VPAKSRDPLSLALEHMEAAIELLDDADAVPVGTSEYLDLAIHNLAMLVDPTGKALLRQLTRVTCLEQH